MTMPMSDQLDERFGGGVHRDGYRIGSLLEADWAARKLMKARQEAADVAREFDEAIAEWQEAKAAAVRKAERDAEFFEHHLTMYLVREVEADPDGDPNAPVTRALPCGVELAYRPNASGSKRLVVDDEATLVAWLRANQDDALKVSVDKTRVKDLLRIGLDVPGVHLAEPEHDPYRVNVPKGTR